MQAKPDCCESPELELVRRVYEPPGPEREVRRCVNCGTFWRFDAEERMNFSGDGDDYREWYTRLTPVEAAELI
jgi:acetyl-CoA carboxylase beta subunit